MSKKNPAVLWTVNQSLSKTDKEQARKNIGMENFQTPKSDQGSALSFVSSIEEDLNDGNLRYNKQSVTVDTSYAPSSSNPASGKSIKAAMDGLATVATTGSYDDLTNKPTIPASQVNSDWDASTGVAAISNKPTFANVADTTTTIDATTPIVVGYDSSTKKLKTRLVSALMSFLGISVSNNEKSFSGKSALAADADHSANADTLSYDTIQSGDAYVPVFDYENKRLKVVGGAHGLIMNKASDSDYAFISCKSALAADADHAANADNATYATYGASGTDIEAYFTANIQNINDINTALGTKQNALPTTGTATQYYNININGNATSATSSTSATNATYATYGASGTDIESYFTANIQNINNINTALNNKQPLCNMYIDGTNASSGTAYTDTVNAISKGYAPMLNVGGIYLPLAYVSTDPNDNNILWYHFEDFVSSNNTVYHRIVKPSSITNSDTTGIIGTDSEYAQKIGTSTSHPQIGGPNNPVYVSSQGIVTPCTYKFVFGEWGTDPNTVYFL